MLHNLDLDIHLFTYLIIITWSPDSGPGAATGGGRAIVCVCVVSLIVSCFSAGPGLAWLGLNYITRLGSTINLFPQAAP